MFQNARRNLVAAMALFGLTAMGGTGAVWHSHARAAQAAKAGAVPTATARKGDLLLKVSATGAVEPEYTVEIKSKASGLIEKVAVQEGDQVDRKQLLIRIDPLDENRKVTQAEADLRIALATRAQVASKLAFAESQLGRTVELEKKGLASGDEVETQRKEAAVLKGDALSSAAQIIRAREALQEAKDRLSETQIFAPISGTILERDVNPGMVVASGTTTVSGGTTLLRMADLSRLFVRVKVDEADVARVQPGQAARITADALPGRALGGTVLRVSPQGKVDSNVTVFEVIVEADAEARKRLRPMMTANVEIVAQKKENVVLLPARAVRQRPGGKGSFVMVGGQLRPVKTGASDGKEVEILEGVQAGEVVALRDPTAAAPAGGQARPAGAAGAMGGMNGMGPMGGLGGAARSMGR